MKKIFFILIFNLFLISIFAQKKEKTIINNRLSVNIGVEYRITPIYKVDDVTIINGSPTIYFNLDKHLSGPSVNYEISYEVFKNFQIGFSHAIRYDHVYYENNRTLLEPNALEYYTIDNSKSKLISDYHLFLKKIFILKNKKIYLKLGYSLMNRGTDYSVTEVAETYQDGSIATIISGGNDLNFSALNVSVGMLYKKFDFGIGAYFVSSNGSNLGNEQKIVIPYFKISYRIF